MPTSGLRCIIVGSTYHFLCLSAVALPRRGGDGAGWCGGLYGRPRHPCPVTRSHSSSAVSTLQRNHKSIEFGASIMSCEYLAGLGEKRMAETGCAIQGSGEESICCRPVVAGR